MIMTILNMTMTILKMLYNIIIKDFLAGILAKTVRDIAMKFIEKTPWAVILERFLTRSLVVCLKWLTTMTTNTLALSTITDFISVMQGNGLKAAILPTDKAFKGVINEVDNRSGSDGEPIRQDSDSGNRQEPHDSSDKLREPKKAA